MPTNVDAGRFGLDLGDDWRRRWTVSWRAGGDDASCSVHDLVQEPVLTNDPMRHFTWRQEPGAPPWPAVPDQYGPSHGAESPEESRVLLTLVFAGDMVDDVSQPLKICVATCGKRRAHTPATSR